MPKKPRDNTTKTAGIEQVDILEYPQHFEIRIHAAIGSEAFCMLENADLKTLEAITFPAATQRYTVRVFKKVLKPQLSETLTVHEPYSKTPGMAPPDMESATMLGFSRIILVSPDTMRRVYRKALYIKHPAFAMTIDGHTYHIRKADL